MSELLWKIGSEERLREFVIEQDRRFQSVMRAYLGIAEPKKVRPVVVKPLMVVPRPRDVLTIASNAGILQEPISWKRIVNDVCLSHGVTKSELIGHQRERRIVLARQEAMYRMKTETTMSLPAIGRKLGGKDHTTVWHGVRKHKALLEAAGL